jgi:hypothetical protein
MANEPIDLLDDNVIRRLGIENLPEEKRLELLSRMTELVQKRVTLRLMENLSEADAAEAEKLADKPEELLAFMGSKTDVGAVIQQETQKLKDELVLGAGVDEPSVEE